MADNEDENRHTVELRKYTAAAKNDTTLFRIDSVNVTLLPQGRFIKDYFNDLHYTATNGRTYRLDMERGVISADPHFYLSEQFSYTGYNASAALRNKYKGLRFRYGEKAIGTVWGQRPAVTRNAIAVEYGDVGTNLDYPKGIKIWTAQLDEWITFDLPWVNAILGWVEEES